MKNRILSKLQFLLLISFLLFLINCEKKNSKTDAELIVSNSDSVKATNDSIQLNKDQTS